MADPAADAALRKELSELSPSDFRGAYADRAIRSKRQFNLLCTPNDKLTDAEKSDKFAALLTVNAWKKRKARVYEHLSGADKVYRHMLKAAAIDDALAEARAKINWERRNVAEQDLLSWIAAYCLGDDAGASRLLDYAPDGRLADAVKLMGNAAGDASQFYHIQIARGFGKTSFAECALAYALATGKRKFGVVVSAKSDSAARIVEDIWNIFTDCPQFVQDYPDISLPLLKLNGSWRRRVSVNGKRLKLAKTTGRFMLPDTPNADGTPSAAANAILVSTGFESKVRGAKHGSQRPDILFLDDLQDDASAASEEIVRKSLERIKRNFLNLGGRNRMAVIFTSTPIQPDDVSEQIAKDAAWRTTSFPAVISWPTEWERENHGLWGEYRAVYEKAVYENDGTNDPHAVATAFYREHREAMDAGAEVLDPQRFDKKLQASALQAVIDTFFDSGEPAFMAEQMMKPVRHAFAVNLTPNIVMKRVRKGVDAGTLITNHVFVAAATDINPSYGFTTMWQSWDVMKTFLIGGYRVTPIKVPAEANDTQFQQMVFDGLADLARTLKESGIPLNKWGIDASGKQWPVVTRFCDTAKAQFGIDAVALTGRAGRNWNPNVSSRVREARNGTVLCRDRATGYRFLAFDADAHKESFQRAFLTEVGAAGGGSIFDGGANHAELAEQLTNERIVDKKPLGGGVAYAYRWKSRDPHDYLDCGAMLDALAGADGLNGSGAPRCVSKHKRRVYGG